MILSRSSSVSEVNRITSSRRLRTSGLKAFLTSLRTISSILVGMPSPMGVEKPRWPRFSRKRAPRLEVMMMQIHQQADDLEQVVGGERGEQDHFVQAVEELGIEGLLDLAAHHLLDLGRDAFAHGRRHP